MHSAIGLTGLLQLFDLPLGHAQLDEALGKTDHVGEVYVGVYHPVGHEEVPRLGGVDAVATETKVRIMASFARDVLGQGGVEVHRVNAGTTFQAHDPGGIVL